MLLKAKELVKLKDEALSKYRETLSVRPGLALVWIGEDKQTEIFVHVKQRKAKALECEFFLHHLQSNAGFEQLSAVIQGLNRRPEIHGIVLQLPLPGRLDTQQVINLIDSQKDVDNLQEKNIYDSPTAAGILELLEYNQIDLASSKTMILGAGRLVGKPLAEYFKERGYPFTQISRNAAEHIDEIRSADVLIAATGVKNIITAQMVHEKMIVVDGSGVDVDVATIEPLVAMVSPVKGAVGALTVSHLFANLLQAARKVVN